MDELLTVIDPVIVKSKISVNNKCKHHIKRAMS